MPRVTKVLTSADPRSASIDTLLLTYAQRSTQHGFVFGGKGTCVELDFPAPTTLATDDVLLLDDGSVVEVVAEAEPVIEVRPPDTATLGRLAWRLGDRHVPAQIYASRLRVLRSPENEAAVAGFGRTTVLIAPFEPEHALAHGHDHAHDHPHDHPHGHDDHEHRHDHADSGHEHGHHRDEDQEHHHHAAEPHGTDHRAGGSHHE